MSWLGQNGIVADPRIRRSLTVGLVNNAADRAKQMTERQFKALLDAASSSVTAELTSLTLADFGDPHRVSELAVDALIVTGMEPTARYLQDEPVWPDLTRLVDWAEDRSVPVLWSCLAAHAAVLYLDGIVRDRLPEKLSGVYDCTLVSPDHPLCAGLPSRWKTPHSRCNDVAEDALVAAGYEILSSTDGNGVDLFAKTCGSVFLFAQGHPEYDASSLAAEYRRDVRRYFLDERRDYPGLCQNYFDVDTEAALTALHRRALERRDDTSILQEVLRVLDEARCSSSWRSRAEILYRNWLSAITRCERGAASAWLTDGDRDSVLVS